MAHILVIDDEATMRETMRAALEASNHLVSEAGNGSQALAVLAAAKPVDLVVADIFMPDIDGLELIPRIRRTYPKMKLIAISGGGRFDATEFLRIAKVLGADQTLLKPFLLWDFSNAIEKLLAKDSVA